MESTSTSFAAQHKWGVAIGTISVLIVIHVVFEFVRRYVLKPLFLQKKMEAQGIMGPAPKMITGNLLEIQALRKAAWSSPMCPPGEVNHDYVSHLFPHFKAFADKYGSKFLMWSGEEPAIVETNLTLALEVYASKHDGAFDKHSNQNTTLASVIGQGLPTVNGTTWLKRRQVVQPAFHAEKVKILAAPMIESANLMVAKWKNSVKAAEGKWTHDVAPDLIGVAADIISRAALHTSYDDAKEIFDNQLELMRISFESVAWSFIPFYNYLPIRTNFRRWALKAKVSSKVTKLAIAAVKELDSNSGSVVPKDLLGLLVAANRDPANASHGQGTASSNAQLVDDIKSILAAGFDTIASTLTWTMMCMAKYPTWQERIYEEVKEVCGDANPDPRSVTKLKVLGMVLSESMRLYPAGPQLVRTARKDVQVGNLRVPKGLSVILCVPIMHRHPDLWGSDANEFKPERFKDGASKASTNPMAMMVFGFGPRTCVAKNLAMLELKILLSIIVKNFKFSLSPTYLHNPVMEGVVMKNKHGVPLILTTRD